VGQINEDAFSEPVRFKTGKGAGLIRDIGQALDLCLGWQDNRIGSLGTLQAALDALYAATDDRSAAAVAAAREALVVYLRASKLLWL